MKLILGTILLCVVVLAGCEGPAGPAGATGPEGPEGADGTDGALSYQILTGTVANEDYKVYGSSNWIVIHDTLIDDSTMTQVLIERQNNLWEDIGTGWQLVNDTIWIDDNTKAFLGWDYMIIQGKSGE